MSYYKNPLVGVNKIVSNQDRYCIIKIEDASGYEGFNKDLADFIYYDKKIRAPVALIKIDKSEQFELIPLVQQDASKKFISLSDLEKNAPRFVQFVFD